MELTSDTAQEKAIEMVFGKGETFKDLEKMLPTLTKKDELGFMYKGKHYVIRQGEFS